MVDAMGGKCQCCGYDKCLDALAFHHIDPAQKDLRFGAIRASPTNWTNVVNELKKSVLVCHNCHSEIHAEVRNIPETRAVFNEHYTDYKKIGKYDTCFCGNQKRIQNKFCSLACAGKNAQKVDWDSIDLLDLLKKHKIGELEKMLGVTDKAIYKRRDKLLKS